MYIIRQLRYKLTEGTGRYFKVIHAFHNSSEPIGSSSFLSPPQEGRIMNEHHFHLISRCKSKKEGKKFASSGIPAYKWAKHN